MPPKAKTFKGLKSEEAKLQKRLDDATEKMKQIYKSIEENKDAMRALCKHQFEQEACEHTHQKATCEVCKLCGKVENLKFDLTHLLQ